MRILPLLLLSSSFALATDFKPFVTATTGLTMPTIDIDEDDLSLDENYGYSFTIGAGVRIPVSDKLSIDGSGGMTFVQGGMTLQETDSYTDEYHDYTETYSFEADYTVSPRIVDLDAGLAYEIMPKFSLSGGITLSIPVGGSWKTSFSVKRDCSGPETDYCEDYEDSDSESGDIDEVEDAADEEVESFASLRVGGEYALLPRLALTAGYLLPMGNWIDDKEIEVAWSRLLIGGRFNF